MEYINHAKMKPYKPKLDAELNRLQLEKDLKEKVEKCIDLINDNEVGYIIELPEFRRMALKHFTDKVLKEGLNLHLAAK